MKSLSSFLNPKRKPNIKFKLPAFEEEFEMRLLSAEEDFQIGKEMQGQGAVELITRYVAESLVVPDLHSKELLDALSEREGKKIIDSVDALKCIVNGAELSALIGVYNDFANVTVDFGEKVNEIKN